MEPPLPHFFFPTSIPIFCEDNESTIEFLLMKKKVDNKWPNAIGNRAVAVPNVSLLAPRWLIDPIKVDIQIKSR